MPDSNLREFDLPAKDLLRSLLRASEVATRPHYSGLIASALSRLINGHGMSSACEGARADQGQQNAAFGVHQFRVRLPGDPIEYRVLVAPSSAPISINGVAVDAHFSVPLSGFHPVNAERAAEINRNYVAAMQRDPRLD